MKQPVTHYKGGPEALDAWKLGGIGSLIRIRGLTVNGLLAFITMGIPWWWPKDIQDHYNISVPVFLAVFCSVCGGMLFASLLYLRKRTIRSLRMKHLLHKLTHDTRDRQTSLHTTLAIDRPSSKHDLTENLLNELCQNLSEFFKTLLKDDSITASIRLAMPHNDPAVKIAYKTVARSTGLSLNRHSTSEAIPWNQGIPRFLRDEKNGQGVLIYHDLKAAAEIGTYKITENDRKYPNDVATMMVAPLNAWSGTKQDMLGLLHITSRRTDVFKVQHVDSILFVADHTATAISNVVELVRLK